jgi:hypothetical protein
LAIVRVLCILSAIIFSLKNLYYEMSGGFHCNEQPDEGQYQTAGDRIKGIPVLAQNKAEIC